MDRNISLLFVVKCYSIIYMGHFLFIHSSAEGHLGCFYLSAIARKAAVNVAVNAQGFVWTRVLLRVYLIVEFWVLR